MALAVAALGLPAHGQLKRSNLDSDPDVVYLEEHLDEPIELRIIKEAPIFSDKEGRRRLGTVVADQRVHLEALTDKAYRVTAQTGGNPIKGWVAPWAFASKDPEFVENFKKLYERQLEVGKLIEANEVAIGMTLDEVGKALGRPSKTTQRRTKEGLSGSWEFIEFEEVSHYDYVRDPHTGRVYRQFSHTTREEKGKTVVEFESGVVTAIEESETLDRPGRVKIVNPPLVFHR
jgi:hypothetical protein